jgi:hypothetical protein
LSAIDQRIVQHRKQRSGIAGHGFAQRPRLP